MTHIDGDAVSGSTNLASATFSTSLISIENNAFEKTKLSTVILPASIEEINARAFADNSLLQTVTIHALTPPLRFPSSFENCPANLRHKVPSSVLNTYKQDSHWQAYSSLIISI